MLLAKNILMQLGLTAAASAAGPTIQTKIYGSGMTMLIILNEEMKDIMKIVKSFEQSGSLIKGVSDTIENEAKKKGGFLGMLAATSRVPLLAYMLAGKGVTSMTSAR